MEYFRDKEKNQIYSDLAYRLGRIVVQYERIYTKDEKFEATLYLSVLQNLMTNCVEHIKQMTKSDRRRESIFNKSIGESNWGIDNSCWVQNTYNERLSLSNFIPRIRNSLSHPTIIDLNSEFPSTGYSTIKDGTGLIQKFRFTNSPDTKNNRPKFINSIEEVYKTIYKSGSENKIVHNEFPTEISYIETELDNQIKYKLMLNGKPFVRLSVIDLSAKQLGSFVKHLANYLAQPIQNEWDGITIKELIAA